MTTFYGEEVQCKLCSTTSRHKGLLSGNNMGSPNLDTRQPIWFWATLPTLVQRCPNCGYCAPDISKAQPNAAAVVASQEYQGQLNDPTFCEETNSFLCMAILKRDLNQFAAAAWDVISAAWTCDDSGQVEQANACRKKALSMADRAEELGDPFTKSDGISTAVRVDLLRRSGQIEQARELISAKRGTFTQDRMTRILAYQAQLLDAGDLSCHTLEETLQDSVKT